MENSDVLDDFRKKWKQEISRAPQNARELEEQYHSIEKNCNGQSNEKSKEQPECNKDQQSSRSFWVDPKVARNLPNKFKPFLVAEELLKSAKSPCRLSSSYGLASSKRPRLSLEDAGSSKKDESPIKPDGEDKRFLDIFLDDINEINDIPFFDMDLPRELAIKIFHHLDMIDLCRCAQVSKAWRSLADDELLWCNICHKLGCQSDLVSSDTQDWKKIVQKEVTSLRNLNSNWKTRTGRLYHLQYPRGGVLCDVDTDRDCIAAGYTNGEVRFWNLKSGEDCTFQPSNKALALVEGQDDGTITNFVTKVAINSTVTVAGFNQGFIDVWDNQQGTSSIHTFKGPAAVSKLSMCKEKSAFAVAYNHLVRVEARQENGMFMQRAMVDFNTQNISMLQLVSFGTDLLLLAAHADWIEIYPITDKENEAGLVTLHHALGQIVTSMDCRGNQIAFGIHDFDGLSSLCFQLRLQCLETQQEISSYIGHQDRISCVNLAESPDHQIVTGCMDKLVRVYDDRIPEAVACLQGHGRSISKIQMDDWKVVSGSEDGMVCVWDQRYANKLWEFHNRHPVSHLHFDHGVLVTANIPTNKFPECDDLDDIVPLRYRGNIHAYDFSEDQISKDIPNICLSIYDEPEGYNYNINLMVPYDSV